MTYELTTREVRSSCERILWDVNRDSRYAIDSRWIDEVLPADMFLDISCVIY